jgi:hypothetical protein
MAVAFIRVKGIRNKFKIIFGKPDNIDPRIRAGLERKLSFKVERPSFLPALTAYIRFQTILSLILLFLVTLFEHYISGPKIFIVALFILLSVINTGSMLEQKRWIFHLELARLALVGIFVRLSFPYFKLTVFLLVLGLSVLLFYKTIGKRYYAYLYG